MATGLIYSYFRATINGKLYEAGVRNTPTEITLTDVLFEGRKSLAAGDVWDAWGFSTEEPVSAFDVLVIESDLSGVLVELTCDKGNDVGREEFVVELVAGLPLILGSDSSMANYTADFASGTADVIDRIRVKNPSGASSSAKVSVMLFD